LRLLADSPRAYDPTVDLTSTAVKFQVITRGDSEEIVVGRLKIPTVSLVVSKKRDLHASTRGILFSNTSCIQPNEGHAFILRRFDTGAISVSTMIRAAFPTLSDDLEKKETTWGPRLTVPAPTGRAHVDLQASGHLFLPLFC
jgi:hypothetical protein